MANSAYLMNTNALKQPAHQATHGFATGEIVVWDGTDWVGAIADNEANCAGAVMVSDLNGADDFWFSQEGKLGPLTNQVFVNGTLYYLSTSSAGNLTATKPNTPGAYLFPCFVATGTDEGIFFGGFGSEIQSDTVSTLEITTNQVLVSNIRYLVNGVGQLTITLPATPTKGDTLVIDSIAATGYILAQNANQQIISGMGNTTLGAGGSITSNTLGDSLNLVCIVGGASARWFVENENTPNLLFT